MLDALSWSYYGFGIRAVVGSPAAALVVHRSARVQSALATNTATSSTTAPARAATPAQANAIVGQAGGTSTVHHPAPVIDADRRAKPTSCWRHEECHHAAHTSPIPASASNADALTPRSRSMTETVRQQGERCDG